MKSLSWGPLQDLQAAPVSWRVSTPQQSVVLRKLGERAVNPVSFRSFLRIVSGFFWFVLFFSLCV